MNQLYAPTSLYRIIRARSCGMIPWWPRTTGDVGLDPIAKNGNTDVWSNILTGQSVEIREMEIAGTTLFKDLPVSLMIRADQESDGLGLE